jgi:succinoglycan biosynthesis transport protein ExoP
VQNSDEIESELGLPLLAAVPAAPVGLSKRLLPKAFPFRRKNRFLRSYYNLPLFERPAFLEAYLQLRTHLMLSTAGGPPQTILVTSGGEGEGKTLTALNLAASLAKNNDSILLIDADLRCPRINLIKELRNDCGLTTLLTAKEINEHLIEKTIQKDNDSNLYIMTAGERSVNPANLLCSEEMRALLGKLSTKYSHIIIDSPPALYFADSTILSTLVDSVIIVVRDNVSSKQSILKVKKLLHNVGAKVIGMVMNGIPRNGTNYNKYRYYEYYEKTADLPDDEDGQVLRLN